MSPQALAPALGNTDERPRTSMFGQWWVLTVRVITPALRNGELITLIGGAVGFTAAFYIPFSKPWSHYVVGANSGIASSLGQYITPLIAMQAVALAAISAAFRAATDTLDGVNRRFGSMPIAPLTPVLARTSASVYRCCIALAVSLICGHVIGFRFYHGAGYIAGFCLLVILVGALLSFGADLIGTASGNPDAMLPLLSLPVLIFGLLSVGVQPIKLFPRWIQPVVRNQPISQIVEVLRALAGDTNPRIGSVTWSTVAPTVAWGLGFVVFLVPLAILVLSKRQR
ncbi:ABC transporter permease [Mycobacterium spongiae]|uniref:Antibiotic ABC transporter permease n=1 Tax=Mycobacterium spongiae TaxID=886343 RepID=A0A975JYE2_9MYCO|nr:ABC transporter permease [Mycobacterium spongiae]QUR66893.1 antibiotic ABC transporter permease [Mycobacterium spongiae]